MYVFFFFLLSLHPNTRPHTYNIYLDPLTPCSVLAEVTLKVHLSDASTHQPLGGVAVQLFANHTSITAETSSAEGNTYLRFPYRLGTPLVVTATKQGYVPNSVPWTPSRLPGKECVCVCVCVMYVCEEMFPVYIAAFQAVDFRVCCLFIVSISVTYKFWVFVPGV